VAFVAVPFAWWALDIYQLATKPWILLRTDDSIPPEKQMEMSIWAGVTALVFLGTVLYGWLAVSPAEWQPVLLGASILGYLMLTFLRFFRD